MRTRQLLLAAGISAILSACATSPEDVPELQQAQELVQKATSSPLASRVATNVNQAQNALEDANQALDDGDDIHTVKHYAYVARSNAQIALEKINEIQAEQKIRDMEGERQQVLAQAREREAQAASQRAQQAQSRAQTAEQRAQELQQEAQRLAMEREQLQQELQSLKDLNARQTERGMVLTLGDDVLFDLDESEIKPGAFDTLDRLAKFLTRNKERTLLVEGHTDATGSADYNMDLSRRRAEAVLAALVERGVPAEQIQARGRGEAFPIASNANAGGRQQNRRVEIVVQNDEEAGTAVAREEE